MKPQSLAVVAFLILCLSGCGSHPQVIIEVDFVTVAADGTQEVHNRSSMSGTRTGTSVSGGTDDAASIYKITLTKISQDDAEVEVSHPEHDSKTIKINYGESADLAFGENVLRIRASKDE